MAGDVPLLDTLGDTAIIIFNRSKKLKHKKKYRKTYLATCMETYYCCN
jgi:hypothetical protein